MITGYIYEIWKKTPDTADPSDLSGLISVQASHNIPLPSGYD